MGLLMVGVGYRLIVDGGLLVSVVPHAPGACRQVGEVPGPEDFALDRERKLLYVSSHNRRHPRSRGALYVVDLRQPLAALAARPLRADYPEDFRPHGLSLLIRPGGERLLYAVSHPEAGPRPLDFGRRHRIEIFAVEGDGLRHAGGLSDEALVNPNDIHVRAEDDIYITRDHGAATPIGKMLEEMLPLARSSILHYNGRSFRVAAEGILYANGVTSAGPRLYVAACLGRAVLEYAIDAPGRLRLQRRLPLPSLPDNLEWDEHGELWTATHPAPLLFWAHALNARWRSPSQALRISLPEGSVEQVYANPGTEISGSSVAVSLGDKMLIGAVFERHLLACSLR